ncbi:MAG: type IV pilus secretin PilQ [Gammaproteobacteria bacterium]|nr:type IV pilus secretin PilQ [Gammaproteobacteria bacterium]
MMTLMNLNSAKKLLLAFFVFNSFFFSVTVKAQVSLNDIEFASQPGGVLEVRLVFDTAPPEPTVFEIESPTRLVMDFMNVNNELDQSRYTVNSRIADSITVVDSGNRTRMIVNLSESTSYISSVRGSTLIVSIGDGSAAGSPAAVTSNSNATSGTSGDIRRVDFRKDEEGAGQIIIDLANDNLVGNLNRTGNRLELEFLNAELDDDLQMRLDVTDFATPVRNVDIFSDNSDVMVVAEMISDFDFLAYQSSGEYIINITSIAGAAAAAAGQAGAFSFTGELINVNLQNVDIHSVLSLLAEINDFSLVVSDSVTGNVTLRLVNVPWDQALDMVLRSEDLGQRIEGTVMYIAPSSEISASELQELENNQQAVSLAPLVTEYLAINYANATTLRDLMSGEGGSILSARGTATVDVRTNTLIIQDIATVIEDVRDMIRRLDIPVRQVLIEARIVNASTSFSDALGVRWGGGQRIPDAGDRFVITGSQEASIEFGNNVADFDQSVASAILGGASIQEALASSSLAGPSFPGALIVDMGVESPSSIALGYAGNKGLLELELAALEASGNGEVIAQPKVTTQDQQLARIESGVQVPYQSQAGGTAGGTSTEFIPAVLSLEVTPQITPDGRINMDLTINQDSVVPGAGAVPSISTNSVTTRVLVNDGDTIVLGGVFREEITTTTSKTPVLGDIPYVGNLFKRTTNEESKTELLIFITPSIIQDLL